MLDGRPRAGARVSHQANLARPPYVRATRRRRRWCRTQSRRWCRSHAPAGSVPLAGSPTASLRDVRDDVEVAWRSTGKTVGDPPYACYMRPVTDLERRVAPFKVVSDYQASGDQPTAIDDIEKRITGGEKDVVLLGATGTGKTATVAWAVERLQRPTLVL